MSSVAGQSSLPLVAVVHRVPLVIEAIAEALDGIADVQSFPLKRGNVANLLRAIKPDGIVVDADSSARQAAEYTRETPTPLVHISVEDHKLRVFENGEWEEAQKSSPEALRNMLIGSLFGRRSRA